MDIRIKEKDGHFFVTLDGELNIYTAAQVNDFYLDELKSKEKVAVDLSKVKELDTSGVQSLISLKKNASKNNTSIKFINHSETVIRIIDLLGLIGLFGDKIKIPSEERQNFSFSYGTKKQEFLT